MPADAPACSVPRLWRRRLAAIAGGARRSLPGLGVSVAVALAAFAAERGEQRLFGRAWLESLVLAILIGMALRLCWTPGARWRPGLQFSATILLEIAVMLLGALVSVAMLATAGWALLVGIAAAVALAIGTSYGVGRALRLPPRMAILVACGNSICGNSAIAAVAPVIGADADDVAASIAFTAVLGVAMALGLPLLGHALKQSEFQFGVFAGMTVYAVPQVLVATAPMGAAAMQAGTLVKLIRVLMLGPTCLVFALLARRIDAASGRAAAASADARGPIRIPLHKFVPWFIVGFLALMAVRSAGLVPAAALPPIERTTGILTTVAMAALGLGVDVRVVAKAGGRVTAAVVLSLVCLGIISLALIRVLGTA